MQSHTYIRIYMYMHISCYSLFICIYVVVYVDVYKNTQTRHRRPDAKQPAGPGKSRPGRADLEPGMVDGAARQQCQEPLLHRIWLAGSIPMLI